MSVSIDSVINFTANEDLKNIALKVKEGLRISDDECKILFEKADLPFVGALANSIREKLHGDITYFNRNFHIEPTNVCVLVVNFVPTLVYMLTKKKAGN